MPLKDPITDVSIRPIILTAGTCTQLWPVSRLAFPKHLLPIAANESMLQDTASRASGDQFAAPIVVGDEDHRFFIEEQLQRCGLEPSAVILEPATRNTAPAIALAANWVLAQGNDELLLILPSDQVISDEGKFHAAIASAVPIALAGGLVTFGIVPDSPHTDYGYIELGDPLVDNPAMHRVARFVEKPNADLASEFVNAGTFLWNSGIFLFRASAILDELKRHAPDVAGGASAASEAFTGDGKFVRPDRGPFVASPNISIDFAVMERTSNAFVLPVNIGWSDVGSWSSLWGISPKNEQGNVIRGPVLALDSKDCLIRSEHDQLVVTIGLNHVGVIATRDAILVSDLDHSQQVKVAVDMLRERGEEAAVSPSEVFRPWGSYQTTDRGDRFQTKRIVVKPGGRLSLQKHHHRSEHWVVVSGTAEVTNGDTVMLLQENESTYIPAGTTHRLANPGKVPLHLIEIQCGPYLGEDDIVRIEDEYGRLEK